MSIVNDSFYVTLFMIFNLVTFFFIFSILLYIDFHITIYASLFFISIYLIVIIFFKKKVFINASTISDEQSFNIKILRETFNGFRDILINNYQKFYNNMFEKSYSKLIKGNEQNRFLYSAPRPVIETFLLSSIGIVISLNANNYSSLEKLIPMIAVLAVASQRILPILNQIYSGHMANVDATPHIYFILNFLKKSNKAKKSEKKIKPLKFKQKIILKNISFTYSKNHQNQVLKDLNLTIRYGERIGIIGHSGSGKSTLGDLILGLLDPSEGEIFVDGKTIFDRKKSWYSNVASVPQNIFVTDQSIAENIAFGKQKNKIRLNQVKIAAKKAQISEFIESRENKYNNLIGEKGLKISTGQRQRIAIARALYKKSKLIIFDEATNSLDVESEKKVLNTIYGLSRKNYTAIIISHKLSNLKKCDHVYKINNSKLFKIK
jgi:ATP-binding cassette subfamily B protein